MDAPSAQTRRALGFRADGTSDVDYYRPALLKLAPDMANAECLAESGAKKVPLEAPSPRLPVCR